jgi:F0F1-type ATP synthase assembly protein I
VVSSWQAEALALAWFIAGAVVGAVLGWVGWRWAKYVDF